MAKSRCGFCVCVCVQQSATDSSEIWLLFEQHRSVTVLETGLVITVHVQALAQIQHRFAGHHVGLQDRQVTKLDDDDVAEVNLRRIQYAHVGERTETCYFRHCVVELLPEPVKRMLSAMIRLKPERKFWNCFS